MYKDLKKCSWIGDGENCDNTVLTGKSYCKNHHERIYTTMYPEMADYLIEKEQNSVDYVLIKTYN